MSERPTSTPDSPLAAFRHFSWRVNLAVALVLGLLSAAAWHRTIISATATDDMGMTMAQMGTISLGTGSPGMFIAMWMVMQTAMMLPTIVPVVLVHLAVSRRRNGSVLPTIAFVAGYLAAWSAVGIVPLLAVRAVALPAAYPAAAAWLPMLAGLTLVLAGAYQFTALKQTCLDRCVSPLAFVVSHDFGRGMTGELRAGLVYGGYCIGCCWALMTVLLVVGMMNLRWMAGIFALVFIEKSWKRGRLLARVSGGALIALGVTVVVSPAVLSMVSG
jgi:predicted metal-binding membrane protein